VEAGKVELSIYNIKGQLVKNLVDGQQDAGMHSVNWNGKDEYNNPVASGVYFSVMKADKEIIRNRMLLLK
jgi:flagellar hook assembly protein FlgD